MAEDERSEAEFDSIQRRKRTRPQSTGKRVTPQERDLLWFRKVHEHGPLPSSYLLAFAQHLGRSEKRAKERLTDLFNEDNTPHGGAYLSRPPQQFRTIDSRYNQLVYDLTPASEAALREAGHWHDRTTGRTGPWLHQFMVACITASIELAAQTRHDLSYIPQRRILDRAEAELRYSTTIRDPVTTRTITKGLIPDAVFGLEYHTAKGSRFRFFALEADRSTEPAMSKNMNRKSFELNLKQYRTYIGEGRYKDHLKLTAPLLVLIVSVDPKHTERMIALTSQGTGGGSSTYVLFQTCTDFGPIFRPPVPNKQFLNGNWRRAANPDFVIAEP